MEAAPAQPSAEGLPSQTVPLEEALARLEENKQQMQKWLSMVSSKIYELETAYLEETPNGNVVKGWEIDARPPIHKSRSIEDKERLFSFSSYSFYTAKKAEDDAAASGALPVMPRSTTQNKSRKSRKRRQDEDWNATEDY